MGKLEDRVIKCKEEKMKTKDKEIEEYYKLQFEPEDMIQKLRELRKIYNPDPIFQLVEPFDNIISSTNTFCDLGSEDLYDLEPLCEGLTLQNLVQRAYVHNLAQLARKLNHYSSNLRERVIEKKRSKKGLSTDTLTRMCHLSLKEFVNYLPVTEKLYEIGKLTKKQKRLTDLLNIKGEELVYILNSWFAPKFEKSRYFLHIDIDLFCRQKEKALAQKGITLDYTCDPARVKEDYITHIVSPLVERLSMHFFNPKRRIFEKEKSQNSIYISGHIENERQRSYSLTIESEGFGISDELLFHLFQPTSEQKSLIDLRDVKHFIKKNKGTIDVENIETYSGNGTSFTITIPYSYNELYSHEGDIICIQT